MSEEKQVEMFNKDFVTLISEAFRRNQCRTLDNLKLAFYSRCFDRLNVGAHTSLEI